MRLEGVSTHQVLWTGGFDSTFRVLSLLNSGNTVQPHYVVEVDRRSLSHELKAMVHIREGIEKAHLSGTLLPLSLRLKNEIPANERVAYAFGMIRERFYLGGQYRWLAEFAKTVADQTLELSVHRDDRAYQCIMEFVRGRGQVRGESQSSDELELNRAYVTLFEQFSFPLLEMTKTQMWRFASEQGLQHLMEMTWFCFKPTMNGSPCGRCNPCQYTIQEGLGWRIPLGRRIIGALDPTVRLRQWAVHRPGAYRWLHSKLPKR